MIIRQLRFSFLGNNHSRLLPFIDNLIHFSGGRARASLSFRALQQTRSDFPFPAAADVTLQNIKNLFQNAIISELSIHF
jgi:hypothetical protein